MLSAAATAWTTAETNDGIAAEVGLLASLVAVGFAAVVLTFRPLVQAWAPRVTAAALSSALAAGASGLHAAHVLERELAPLALASGLLSLFLGALVWSRRRRVS